MNYKPIYEFLVWDNCSNNCKFCFQRKNPRLFNHDERKIILNEVINFINSDKFIKNSHILICGGEIFDKPNDYDILIPFFKKICDLMTNNIIDLLYINTNLIYRDLKPLTDFLNLIKEYKLFNRLKFTSSYDLEGRFRNKDDENIMLNNLLFVKKTFPDCNIVVNTILTKKVCNDILNDSYNIQNFMNTYQCWVNLIPYIIYDENLSASRNDIFKALKTINNQSPGYLQKYIPNMSIEQEKWLYLYKDNKFQFCSCKISDCGHAINFKRYSDKGTCFCCDLKEIFENYEE